MPCKYEEKCVYNNLSSTAATNSLHGIGISLFQHPSFEREGEKGNLTQNITRKSCSLYQEAMLTYLL